MIWLIMWGVVMFGTLYYVLALLFHWVKYGSTFPLVWLAIPIYLGGVGFLTLVSLTALTALL